jgi:hypothetical protein
MVLFPCLGSCENEGNLKPLLGSLRCPSRRADLPSPDESAWVNGKIGFSAWKIDVWRILNLDFGPGFSASIGAVRCDWGQCSALSALFPPSMVLNVSSDRLICFSLSAKLIGWSIPFKLVR